MEAMTSPPGRPAVSFYDAVGGAATFERLVAEFYARVDADPVLRPLYPEADLTDAETRLRMFLEQYWGGPRTYAEQRGHPRLRARHAEFTIGKRERDAWLTSMRQALNTLHLLPEHEATLWDYLVSAAHSLVNAGPAGEAPPAGATSLSLLRDDPPRGAGGSDATSG